MSTTTTSDEDLARKLQNEFDREAAMFSTQEDKDKRLASSLASKFHEISDSESEDLPKKACDQDSDSTLDLSPDSRASSDLISSPSPVKEQNDFSDSGEEGPSHVNGESSDEESQSLIKRKRKTLKERPECPYGRKCYRKNPSHVAEFWHPEQRKRSHSPTVSQPKKQRLAECMATGDPSLGFHLTKVRGVEDRCNGVGTMGIQDILNSGPLERSVQFNFKIDIPWLVAQYPVQHRRKPLLVVHGSTRQEKAVLDKAAKTFSHVELCQAKLDIIYGTHHTKMMILLFTNGMQVVIHTANLIHGDWHQRTQGVWMSPLFSALPSQSTGGDSPTHFKRDLLQYLSVYKDQRLNDWISIIKRHDLSSARVFLIASVPGRHSGPSLNEFGHLKLRKLLKSYGPSAPTVKSWPVLGQFSSIGSLGATSDSWLSSELHVSLSAARGSGLKPRLHLVYPCRDDVRLSLEGYGAGGSLPYSINTAKKQSWLHTMFHRWRSECCGRSKASPHIKTYLRASPDWKTLAWFILTSANLSKAAWGMLEKNGSQLMIRSYELGILFLPQPFGEDVFHVAPHSSGASLPFMVPYDLPPTPYQASDRPWVWDIPYVDKPDTHGNKWCPS